MRTACVQLRRAAWALSGWSRRNLNCIFSYIIGNQTEAGRGVGGPLRGRGSWPPRLGSITAVPWALTLLQLLSCHSLAALGPESCTFWLRGSLVPAGQGGCGSSHRSSAECGSTSHFHCPRPLSLSSPPSSASSCSFKSLSEFFGVCITCFLLFKKVAWNLI